MVLSDYNRISFCQVCFYILNNIKTLFVCLIVRSSGCFLFVSLLRVFFEVEGTKDFVDRKPVLQRKDRGRKTCVAKCMNQVILVYFIKSRVMIALY